MKKNIRRGVFETNSSSTHSLCIKNEKVKFDDIPQENNITIKQNEFGWECSTYNDYRDKLSYMYTYVKSCFYEPTKEQEKEIKENIEYLKSAILEVCPNILIEEDNDYEGYIDHSHDLKDLWSKFRQDKELLKSFLFSSESALITSNDNGGYEYSEERENKYKKKGFFIYYKSN